MAGLKQHPHKQLTSMGNSPGASKTKLTSEQDQGYSKWLGKLPKDMDRSGKDYDLKAAYDAGEQADSRGHLDDKFKKPNHMTFSDESRGGGHWSGPATGVNLGQGEQGRSWTFRAGPANLAAHTPEEMGDYFRDKEPNSILVTPLKDIPGAKKAP